MLENHAIAYIILVAGIPCLACLIVEILERLPKYYYVHDGWRWKKKRYRK